MSYLWHKIITMVSSVFSSVNKGWMLATGKSHVSCSAVLVEENHTHHQLFSHMLFLLEIDNLHLGDREGVSSTMVSTLIHLLCQLLYPHDGVLTPLANIITSAENCINITVATSKVPEFGPEYQNPVYGYTVLGDLSQFTPILEQPAVIFQHRYKLTAVHDIGHPTTFQFKRNWSSGMQLDLTKHFIIIFVKPAPYHVQSTHSVIKNWRDLSAFHQLPSLSELSEPHHVFSHSFKNSTSNYTPSQDPNGITSKHSSSNSPFSTFESSTPVPQDYTSLFSPSAPVLQEYSLSNSPYSTLESSAPPLTKHISASPLQQHSSSYSPLHLLIGLSLLQPAQGSNVLLDSPSYSTGPLLPQSTSDSGHDEVKPCMKAICYNKGCSDNLIK